MTPSPQGNDWTLAIETGGTFTDLFLVGPDGRVHTDKIPSTPEMPERAALRALERGCELAGIHASALTRLLHGSTVAVNALIERKAPAPAVIATRGFRDLLFIGRQEKTRIYDMFYRKPEPFTRRELVFEVNERMDAGGNPVVPLDTRSVERALERIADTGVRSVAICLLHSYANDEHEREVAAIAARRHPGLRLILSCEVCPVHREYERTSTTLVNAYLHPVVEGYLERLAGAVEAAGVSAPPLIMQANGGVLPMAAARRRPAGLYLSGPAAGVSGAARLAGEAGLPSLITLDVGGTSSDICLITDGVAHEAAHGGASAVVQGQPLNMVMTDIVTIGAGGGSLARIDDGGMLRVGPESAGADPGPAAYDRGGAGFTLTDAFLGLGLLTHGAVLPGGIRLSASSARAAGEATAQRLGLDPGAVADAVYRIAVANMAEAIRGVTVHRGLDPRDYVLFACGGAGALVAAPLAGSLGIDTVLVPPDPGVFSAFGLTAASLRMDFAAPVESGTLCGEGDGERLAGLVDRLERQAVEQFATLGFPAAALTHSLVADARYAGQGYELAVPLDGTRVRGLGSAHVADGFHPVHAQRYGHAFPDQPVELVTLRLTATIPAPESARSAPAVATPGEPTSRVLSLDGAELRATVRERADLGGDETCAGPALLLEPTTTTLVPPGWSASRTSNGVLALRRTRR